MYMCVALVSDLRFGYTCTDITNTLLLLQVKKFDENKT